MTDIATLTRADLAETIKQQIGLSRSDSSNIIESIMEHILSAAESGENVKISGFGTFVIRDKAPRIGRNPKTGVEAEISKRRVLTFRASQGMRSRIS